MPKCPPLHLFQRGGARGVAPDGKGRAAGSRNTCARPGRKVSTAATPARCPAIPRPWPTKFTPAAKHDVTSCGIIPRWAEHARKSPKAQEEVASRSCVSLTVLAISQSWNGPWSVEQAINKSARHHHPSARPCSLPRRLHAIIGFIAWKGADRLAGGPNSRSDIAYCLGLSSSGSSNPPAPKTKARQPPASPRSAPATVRRSAACHRDSGTHRHPLRQRRNVCHVA